MMTCTHCGKTGHEISDCYQIKGFFEWWEESGRGGGAHGGFRGRGCGSEMVGSYGRGHGFSHKRNAAIVTANAAQVVSPQSAVAGHVVRRHADFDRSSLLQCSDEKWTSLISFINTPRPDQTEKLNGKGELVEFIIDTGASHHMTWNINYLTNVVYIIPCSIELPDGDCTLALKHGDLCLGGDMWLRGVLYAPNLKCSLISVAKLLKEIKGSSITFTADLCVLQDHTKMTSIGAGEECGGVYKFRGVIGGVANKAAATNTCTRDLGIGVLVTHQVGFYLIYRTLLVWTNQLRMTQSVILVFGLNKLEIVFMKVIIKLLSFFFYLVHCDVWGCLSNSFFLWCHLFF